jgi:hypothetical protein
MQCVDCHNRPAHTFELPERAIDHALAVGRIPLNLPYMKKKGVELLKAEYASQAEAAEKIPAALARYYREAYPDLATSRTADIERAARELTAIWERNVFPDLKVTWGAYPNNIGHTDSPGCFRCHDGRRATADGKTIAQSCSTCHEMPAIADASPEVLKTLGLANRISALRRQ